MGARDDRAHETPSEDASEEVTGQVMESRVVAGVSRESLFERLLDVERFPEWGYGLRRVRLRPDPSGAQSLHPGARIEFGLRAAGMNHRVTSLVTRIEPPRLIEWQYLSGATGRGGWLLEEAGDLVRMTLSTDYSVEPPWLDKLAHRPFFRALISDLLSRSLRRLEDGLEEGR